MSSSEDSAYVTMTVGVVKRVKLTVNLLPGGGATGEQAKCDISPSTITVVGSEEELEGLTEISLGSIDLSQVVDTATISKPIVLSPTLENADGVTEAQVTVVVEGLSTKTVTVTNIETVNQPDNYQVDVVTQERVVVIRGSESVLESLDASQIRIVADLSDVTATGTYPRRQRRVYLNASDEVGPVGTYTINVNVRKRDRRELTERETFGGETLEPICTGEKAFERGCGPDLPAAADGVRTEGELRRQLCRLRPAASGGAAGHGQRPHWGPARERVEVELSTRTLHRPVPGSVRPARVFLALGYLVGQALGLGRGPRWERPLWAFWWGFSRRCGDRWITRRADPGVCGRQTGDTLTGGLCSGMCAPCGTN